MASLGLISPKTGRAVQVRESVWLVHTSLNLLPPVMASATRLGLPFMHVQAGDITAPHLMYALVCLHACAGWGRHVKAADCDLGRLAGPQAVDQG